MSVIGSRQYPAPGRRQLLMIPAACAALLAVLVYLNALDNPFVYDDFRVIVSNPSILDVRNLESVIGGDITRPLVNLSYAIDTALWGQTSMGYHVTSLLLHVVNVVLVFWVSLLASEDRLRQAGQRVGRAASPAVIASAAAVLFAVHPMMTQAVGYVSARSELAYSTLFLCAFLAGRRWMLGGGKRWWLVCVGLWALAMLAKETAAMLAFVLFAYDRFVLDAPWVERRRRLLRLELPLFAVTAVAGAGRIVVLQLVEYSDGAGPDWRLALVAVDAFWGYLTLFFFPRAQTIFHALPSIDTLFSAHAIVALVRLAGFLGVAWALRRTHSLMTFGLLWFALLLLPSSVLFAFGRGEPMAEHRAYLSAAGLFLCWGCAFGALWARSGWRRAAAVASAVVVLMSFGGRTILRNMVWQDPVVLAREAKDLAPGHWIPQILMADALRQNGRCSDAVDEYRAAIASRPVEEYPYSKLALCLIEGGRREEARHALLQLRAVNPASIDASKGLGVLALLDNRLTESRTYLQDALRVKPDDVQAKLGLALIDGTLPAAERWRFCGDLERINGKQLMIDVCRSDTRHSGRGSSISADN